MWVIVAIITSALFAAGFGAFMAKRHESLLVGRIMAAFGLLVAVLIWVVIFLVTNA